jgi:hypothetical protein
MALHRLLKPGALKSEAGSSSSYLALRRYYREQRAAPKGSNPNSRRDHATTHADEDEGLLSFLSLNKFLLFLWGFRGRVCMRVWLSHKCFCSKETLEENLAQDAPRVFLCYKNTYARENYSPRRGPVPGRKAGRSANELWRDDVIPLAT